MNTSRLLKILSILAVTALVTGCKLLVVSPPGGDVTSLSSTRNCAGGSVCEFLITNGFSESFTAVPKPGYQFVRWEKGTGLNCGDSTNPTCTVALTGNAAVDAIAIATFEIIHIMPIYKDVGIDTDGDGMLDRVDGDDDNDGISDGDDNCPLVGPNLDSFGCPIDADVVTVNGRIWYQPDRFLGAPQSAIAAVCPQGICEGVLMGKNLTGWRWADGDDVLALFAVYGPFVTVSDQIANHTAMVDGGFREHNYNGIVGFSGWTSESGQMGVSILFYAGHIGSVVEVDQYAPDGNIFGTAGGGWFYRDR